MGCLYALWFPILACFSATPWGGTRAKPVVPLEGRRGEPRLCGPLPRKFPQGCVGWPDARTRPEAREVGRRRRSRDDVMTSCHNDVIRHTLIIGMGFMVSTSIAANGGWSCLEGTASGKHSGGWPGNQTASPDHPCMIRFAGVIIIIIYIKKLLLYSDWVS